MLSYYRHHLIGKLLSFFCIKRLFLCLYCTFRFNWYSAIGRSRSSLLVRQTSSHWSNELQNTKINSRAMHKERRGKIMWIISGYIAGEMVSSHWQLEMKERFDASVVKMEEKQKEKNTWQKTNVQRWKWNKVSKERRIRANHQEEKGEQKWIGKTKDSYHSVGGT